jgi:hypothetical protein
MPENTKFQFVITEDDSFSARIGAPGLPKEECSEAMHSLRGAFSETVYVYGTAIQKAADEQFNERTLSMGLGLGYVELLSAAIALKANRKVAGESFEIVPELRDYFTAWLSEAEGATSDLLPADFRSAYTSICRRTAETYQLEPAKLHKAFAAAVESGHWKIREALCSETDFSETFGCICFDAFSSKTTPDLWSEDFLRQFLQKTAASNAVLSTYACTGALKRALKAENFTVTIREGFSSKRDSTFAVRK